MNTAVYNSSVQSSSTVSILALDFDGVLCDSVDETVESAWSAAQALWDDLAYDLPPGIRDAFRGLRPRVEYGYETVLVIRLLADGIGATELSDRYPALVESALERSGRTVDELKVAFGAARDRSVALDPGAWADSSPLYPGVANWLSRLSRCERAHVVTTKEERFVLEILARNRIPFDPARVFGLDRHRPKEESLRAICGERGRGGLLFVEDRLATLERVRACEDLAGAQMALAGWGYNTEADRRRAAELDIPVWQPARLFATRISECHDE